MKKQTATVNCWPLAIGLDVGAMNAFHSLVFCLLMCFALISTSWAFSKDPRLAKITAPQLRYAAMKEPLDVQYQSRLLSRANQWGLQAEAYRLYKQRAAKEPKDADAHLLYAMAARLYAENRFLGKPGAQQVAAYGALLPEIRGQFGKAIALEPQNALINLSYGYWLWQFDGDMNKGLRLVETARKLNPKHAGVLATLGSMYANPSGNCYDVRQAEGALKSATQLDPNYAFPRWHLMSLLYEQKKFVEAKQQLNAYVAVVPTETANSSEISQWQKILG